MSHEKVFGQIERKTAPSKNNKDAAEISRTHNEERCFKQFVESHDRPRREETQNIEVFFNIPYEML